MQPAMAMNAVAFDIDYLCQWKGTVQNMQTHVFNLGLGEMQEESV